MAGVALEWCEYGYGQAIRETRLGLGLGLGLGLQPAHQTQALDTLEALDTRHSAIWKTKHDNFQSTASVFWSMYVQHRAKQHFCRH